MVKSSILSSDNIIRNVASYYTDKINQHGTTPAGVDWKDQSSQILRFSQLYQIIKNSPSASLLDLGCGYGAFLPYARSQGYLGHYTGLDCATAQIEGAKTYIQKTLPDDKNYSLLCASSPTSQHDYAIESGIFSVKMNIDPDTWHAYILNQLDLMNAHCSKGFAFNCLTDLVDWRRDDLYYANPTELFDVCRRRYSRHVALLSDYGLYEFTILVRKEI